EEGRKDPSLLGDRAAREPRRHGMAVLESHGLHAGGAAGYPHAAAEVPVEVPGEALPRPGLIAPDHVPCMPGSRRRSSGGRNPEKGLLIERPPSTGRELF